ncbi:hypothetical protein Q8A67_021058 [Cirrhinus molitorella]|uniref:Uncharacterized protein n=1 Tax=Cirrhinus molitorella TaxID=172907 RepID=A0AA88P9W3_9TELE|nr:hypothetical protein Q8A67_021058 [Cirrhinus molitorella]
MPDGAAQKLSLWPGPHVPIRPTLPSPSAGLNEEPLTALAPAGSRSAAGGPFGSRDPSAQVEYLFVSRNHNHGSLATQIPAAIGFMSSLGQRTIVFQIS